MRSASFAIVLCIMLMAFLLPSTLAFDQDCFNDCIDKSLCEAPRISQCIARCRALCGGAKKKLGFSSSHSCKLRCSVNLCSKFASDAKEHQTCSEKCSKKFCKF